MRSHSVNVSNPTSSPCIRQCCLDKEDVCLGCFRTLEEIINWTKVDAQTRQHFLDNAQQRKIRYQQETGVNKL